MAGSGKKNPPKKGPKGTTEKVRPMHGVRKVAIGPDRGLARPSGNG